MDYAHNFSLHNQLPSLIQHHAFRSALGKFLSQRSRDSREISLWIRNHLRPKYKCLIPLYSCEYVHHTTRKYYDVKSNLCNRLGDVEGELWVSERNYMMKRMRKVRYYRREVEDRLELLKELVARNNCGESPEYEEILSWSLCKRDFKPNKNPDRCSP